MNYVISRFHNSLRQNNLLLAGSGSSSRRGPRAPFRTQPNELDNKWTITFYSYATTNSKNLCSMRKSPITVQQWLETIPAPSPTETPKPNTNMYNSPTHKPSLRLLGRDMSVQSDDCSHCSSVESVLEFRRADPEAVLLGLGFGPPNSGQYMSRIPARFLQQSKLLTKIDINKFLEEQGELQPDQQQQQFNSNPPSPARMIPKSC